MEAMRALGINPAYVACPAERPEGLDEPVVREPDGDLTDAEFAALEPALPPEPIKQRRDNGDLLVDVDY